MAVALAAGFIGFRVVPAFHATKVVATTSAQRQTFTLADGSRADLNAHTIVSTDFGEGRRQVRLDRGEALFSVAKDPSRPFFVETPAGKIRVTGTVFNVRLSQGGRLEVTVLEGSVSVQATESTNPAVAISSEPLWLKPGEQLTLTSAPPQVRMLSPTDLENILAWKQGRIVFEAMSLHDAAARFAEFHGRVISVAPEAATLRLSGSYSLDNLESFFGALAEALPISVVGKPDGSFRIIRR